VVNSRDYYQTPTGSELSDLFLCASKGIIGHCILSDEAKTHLPYVRVAHNIPLLGLASMFLSESTYQTPALSDEAYNIKQAPHGGIIGLRKVFGNLRLSVLTFGSGMI